MTGSDKNINHFLDITLIKIIIFDPKHKRKLVLEISCLKVAILPYCKNDGGAEKLTSNLGLQRLHPPDFSYT